MATFGPLPSSGAIADATKVIRLLSLVAAGKSGDFRVVPPATRSQLYAYMGNARVPRSLRLEGGNI